MFLEISIDSRRNNHWAELWRVQHWHIRATRAVTPHDRDNMLRKYTSRGVSQIRETQ